MSLHLRVAAHSEVGLVRKNNQDSGYASPHLLVVADGMGGAAAGDLASAVAIDTIKRLDTPDLLAGATTADPAPPPTTTDDPDADRENGEVEDTVIVGTGPDIADVPPEQGAAGRNPLLGRFAAAIAEANATIADLVAADYSLEGMGTTVTGAVFDGARLGLAHIGDSRAYLLRDGRLERLTHDHSWVQSLVDDGKITPEEAAYHPHRSLLLKVLNGQPANDPDLTTVELRAGDRVLFCSDGLCGLIDDDEIAELAAAAELEQAVTDLVDAALAAGGIDNVTVILAEAVEGTETPASTAAGGGTAAEPTDTNDADDDTAVRRAVGAATVLGAAAEREIPTVPRRYPRAPGPDDEDETDKDETERGPTAGSDRAPTTADDESRYAPRPPAKRRVMRTLLVGLVVLLVTAAGLGAGYAWTRTQYFVGAAGDQVAIYQGLPDGLPGVPLATVFEVQDLPVASLPPYYRAQVAAGIEVSSLDAARATVEQLRGEAARCAPPTPTPTPTTKPTPSTAATPTTPTTTATTATATATGQPSVTPSTRPTPTVTIPSTPNTATTSPTPGQGC